MSLNSKIDEWREGIIKDSQMLLKIKSVESEAREGMPFGEGPKKALNCALEIADRLGFKTTNLENYVGFAEFGEGQDYVAVLGHVDVVPEGDNWTYPPYGAEIHDGKIYARGAIDDKCPMIAALYALKAVRDEGLKLSKRVRIIFGTNEETRSEDMHYYVKKEKPPVWGFTPDGDYPIINGEKGITLFDLVKKIKVRSKEGISIQSIKGGQRANMVPDFCEATLKTSDITKATNFSRVENKVKEYVRKTGYDITASKSKDLIVIKSIGVSAHGSLPHLGKNAIMQLFGLLVELPLAKDDVSEIVTFFQNTVGMEHYGESFGIGLEDKVSGKLTFNVGCINLSQTDIKVSLNIRYPVTYCYEDMMDPFLEKIKGTGLEVENMVQNPPLYFDEEHPLIRSLLKVYVEQTGLKEKLLSIGGSTYAKEMPNIVAFGALFPGRPDLAHQADEYIEIEDLMLNAKIFAHAIYELAK